MSTRPLLFASLLTAALASGCAFPSTATHWNGLVGHDGVPVELESTTNVGVNFLVVFKVFGETDTDGMVDELTRTIADKNGDRVRIVQSKSENYWYGFPPFTWIVTPVVTTVAAEYQPADAAVDTTTGTE